MQVCEVQQEVPRKLKPLPLRQVRLNLGMTQLELSTATYNILGADGIDGVHINQIKRCEHFNPHRNDYDPIRELTATKILMTINAIHRARGRLELGIDDIIWNIPERRKRQEAEKRKE